MGNRDDHLACCGEVVDQPAKEGFSWRVLGAGGSSRTRTGFHGDD
ncbi:hypothetical protein ACTWQF_18020 [Streptomyces sp. 8N114]